jgi:arylsulfatase A-like enzyme
MVVRFDRLVTHARDDTDHLVLNIDLAPTIAGLAGVEAPLVDGRSLVPLLAAEAGPWRRDFLVEHLEGTNPVPTYCAVRSGSHLYVEYRTGERELYDLRTDPFQLIDLAGQPASSAAEARYAARLDVLCDPPPPDVAPLSSASQPGRSVAWIAVAALLAAALALVTRRVPRPPVDADP